MVKRFFIISFAVALIDQISKLIIINLLTLNESIKIITNFFYITYLQNTGVAFGLEVGKRSVLIGFSVVALMVIIKWLLSDDQLKNKEKWGFALLIGGVIGNLVDRIFYGYVIDWLDFYFFNYNYPVFNIADLAIVSGAVLIILGMGGRVKDGNDKNKS